MPDPNDDVKASRASAEPIPQGRTEKQPLRVNLPAELPELTPEVSRILLNILIELRDNKIQQMRISKERRTEYEDGIN
ncbi:hypothetical protein AB0M48_35270 [Lentzea sp. NPDC051208]|uniref:hypothetical protein n=1 Tax=Lentzea sp. NPDC051208 TaxID=3154642 RepID=UPI0034495696